MMHTVGSYEAKTHLPELLDRVARGDTVLITKRGVPVAQLVPPGPPARPNPSDVIEDLIAYSRSQRRTLGGMTIRALIEDGRRF
jgi:prevent-host-death family protein